VVLKAVSVAAGAVLVRCTFSASAPRLCCFSARSSTKQWKVLKAAMALLVDQAA
jgi:hypothetical protein